MSREVEVQFSEEGGEKHLVHRVLNDVRKALESPFGVLLLAHPHTPELHVAVQVNTPEQAKAVIAALEQLAQTLREHGEKGWPSKVPTKH